MPLMQMADTDNARQEVFDRVGDVSHIDLFANKVLVGIYLRSTTLKSGIIIPDKVRDEDLYQGKVGLVLAMGPIAFEDDAKVKFHRRVKVGDWVMFRASDTWALDINSDKGNCRMIDDVDVRAVLDQPDKVW